MSLMPADLSMWDLNPKNGNTPLEITWLGYLTIAGYYPSYEYLDNEYVGLQVDMGNGQFVDIPGQTAFTSYNQASGYHGYFVGQYSIPSNWPPGNYKFRVAFNTDTTKGIAAATSPTITVIIGGSSTNDKTVYIIIGGALIAGTAVLAAIASRKPEK